MVKDRITELLWLVKTSQIIQARSKVVSYIGAFTREQEHADGDRVVPSLIGVPSKSD